MGTTQCVFSMLIINRHVCVDNSILLFFSKRSRFWDKGMLGVAMQSVEAGLWVTVTSRLLASRSFVFDFLVLAGPRYHQNAL